jgi:hypothetical protein
MLTDQQKIFLERYQNEKGDVHKVLNSMDLEIHHLISWRSLKNFEIEYKDTQRKVVSFLNSENYVMGLRRLNEVLETGVSDEVVTTKQRVIQKPLLKRDDEDSSGQSDDNDEIVVFNEYEVTRKVIKKGIPPQMITLAVQQNTVVQALNVLTTQGIIPEDIARKLLAKSEEIAKDMQAAFAVEKETEQMTQAKAIELMKQAVLRGVADN